MINIPPAQLIAEYFSRNYRVVFWPCHGDVKGPTESGWTQRIYTQTDYRAGDRVGLVTGVEVQPKKFLHDVDIDWAPGWKIAVRFLPQTDFVFGHGAKEVSHCFYTLPGPLTLRNYYDISDGTTKNGPKLLELRGASSSDSGLGFQTMVPPSVWSKNGQREPLTFKFFGDPLHVTDVEDFIHRLALAAIGMLLAKHFGHNGFGHEPRLAFAGFLLRAGVAPEECITMGEQISLVCNNIEINQVRTDVESTQAALLSKKRNVTGAPTLEKIFGGTKGRRIIERILEWLGHAVGFHRSKSGQILSSTHNILYAVQSLKHELAYDEFSHKPMLDGAPIDDNVFRSLRFAIEREYRFLPLKDTFDEVCMDFAWSNRYHPVLDYLNKLTWDGVPRIESLLIDYGQAEDTPFVREVMKLFLIAAVRRVRQPGCKFDEMLVLRSKQQGVGKSSFAQALCPNPKWFSDDFSLNVQSKELIETTDGKWIIEASDLAGKRKVEIERLKAMLSRQVDGPARMAWERKPTERRRQFVLFGTTNSPTPLNDPTGARRFWPVLVGRFDIDGVVRVRDQIWAEASALEARGLAIRLREDLWPDAEQRQSQIQEIDPWEDKIHQFLWKLKGGLHGRIKVTTEEIWTALGVLVQVRDRVGANRISHIMQKLGMKSTVLKVGDDSVRGYIEDETNSLKRLAMNRTVGEDDDVIEKDHDATPF